MPGDVIPVRQCAHTHVHVYVSTHIYGERARGRGIEERGLGRWGGGVGRLGGGKERQ